MFLHADKYEHFYSVLGYRFKDVALLQQAMTRKSGFLENKQEAHIGHNGRLEFFGDSILRMVIDNILMDLYPNDSESQLSIKRDNLVSNHGKLHKCAENLGLDEFIISGKGEQKSLRGNGKKKILSDTMEAIIAAIFIDSDNNYQIIKKFIIKQWDFQPQYNKHLIAAIAEENISAVKHWLTSGADPNAFGETTIYKYGIGEIGENKNWGEDKVTLFWGEYLGTALNLAILNKRVIRPVSRQPNKPSPGRHAYIDSGSIYSAPLQLQSKNPTLEDIFAILAPIELGEGSAVMVQNLILQPHQPGYWELAELFSPEISRSCFKILQLLLAYGADPNKQDKWENTALHIAAPLGNPAVIKLFLRAGADVTITNREGNMPIFEAKSQEIAELLMPVNDEPTTFYTDTPSSSSSAFFKQKLETNTEETGPSWSCVLQ